MYDPNGAGAIVFAALAVSAEEEREGIREKTLEGLDAAARKGNHGEHPSAWTTTSQAVARARHAKEESVSAIAKALEISRAPLSAHRRERLTQAHSSSDRPSTQRRGCLMPARVVSERLGLRIV
ncbi:hypothetical protein P8A22_31405 [Streptomyces laculatispora]|uniref:Resolvase/invertase-type recombinase catalytic domain-containing protein n=1 Tax=Streptomyces laculatispora TaxID=887464 RepID=A0ABY9IAV5_9ACTN|nr:hypothetical protein [Streptomyces laculatispora]WLQ44030.1 hypothetical protein P8A22_31405 [Streptomyces laculatispora]